MSPKVSKLNSILQIFFLVAGFFLMVLTIAFFVRADWAVNIWPWPEGRLSFIFLASIWAAAGTQFIYLGITGEFRAGAAGAFTFSTMFAGLTFHFYRLSVANPGNHKIWAAAVVCGIMFLLSVGVIVWARSHALRNQSPAPPLARISFAIFVIALMIAGGQMSLASTNVMPWPLDPRSCVAFGWIFIGAAAGFIYAIIEPYWPIAEAQLSAFLAYDLVLIIPYIQHFATVKPENLINLTIYTAVLIYSGSVAVYFLILNRPVPSRSSATATTAA